MDDFLSLGLTGKESAELILGPADVKFSFSLNWAPVFTTLIIKNANVSKSMHSD